ncbi:MAG: 2-oxoglutarate-acceptor oxidoreductase subunit OorD [Firmicutes bacterium]|nr:2-oxoglutarate-acceptor oxidoreductase subunit OorD [Bacillota bacterium]
MPKVEILEARCKSCGLCIEFCPKKVLKIGEKANAKGYYFVEVAKPDQCIGCALCGTMCPDVAITVYK